MAPKWTDRIELQSVRAELVDKVSEALPGEQLDFGVNARLECGEMEC